MHPSSKSSKLKCYHARTDPISRVDYQCLKFGLFTIFQMSDAATYYSLYPPTRWLQLAWEHLFEILLGRPQRTLWEFDLLAPLSKASSNAEFCRYWHRLRGAAHTA